jgi:LacI family transcriptional regulator
MGRQIDDGGTRRATMRDVAARAGVNPATVSRVLSGSRGVRPESRRAVIEAAEALGYETNGIARALRLTRSGAVGMVVPDLVNPFFPAVVEAVEEYAEQAGFQLFLCSSRDDVEWEASRLDRLREHRVDGVLISPVDSSASAQAVRRTAASVPLVQVDRWVDAETDWVGVDQAQGVSAIADLLREAGCERVCYVTCMAPVSVLEERLEAVRAELPRADVVEVPDLSVRSGLLAADRLSRHPELQAVVCANDPLAVGVLKGLQQRDAPFPVLVGFDDSLGWSANPEFSSVRQPVEELGKQAIALLVQRVSGMEIPVARHVRLAPRLIIRNRPRAL